VLVADKAGINKILIEEDLVKAPFFDGLRLHPGNPMLVTERDKVSHKHVVSSDALPLPIAIMLTVILQRRLLSPGFSVSYLNGLEPLMQECIQDFEKFLDVECEKGNGTAVIDMQGMLSNLTFVQPSSFP